MSTPNIPERQRPAEPPRVYSPDEAAEVLHCRPSWLRDMARRRRIPFTLIGGAYRWTPDHLAEIVRLGEQHPVRAVIDSARQRASVAADDAAPLLQARPPRRARPSGRREVA